MARRTIQAQKVIRAGRNRTAPRAHELSCFLRVALLGSAVDRARSAEEELTVAKLREVIRQELHAV